MHLDKTGEMIITIENSHKDSIEIIMYVIVIGLIKI